MAQGIGQEVHQSRTFLLVTTTKGWHFGSTTAKSSCSGGYIVIWIPIHCAPLHRRHPLLVMVVGYRYHGRYLFFSFTCWVSTLRSNQKNVCTQHTQRLPLLDKARIHQKDGCRQQSQTKTSTEARNTSFSKPKTICSHSKKKKTVPRWGVWIGPLP